MREVHRAVIIYVISICKKISVKPKPHGASFRSG